MVGSHTLLAWRPDQHRRVCLLAYGRERMVGAWREGPAASALAGARPTVSLQGLLRDSMERVRVAVAQIERWPCQLTFCGAVPMFLRHAVFTALSCLLSYMMVWRRGK